MKKKRSTNKYYKKDLLGTTYSSSPSLPKNWMVRNAPQKITPVKPPTKVRKGALYRKGSVEYGLGWGGP